MANIKIEYLGDLRTRCTHNLSGNQFITDAPPDNRGKGESFSPTDLFATSLGSCIITIMGMKARDLEIDITGATLSVRKIMGANPRRIERVEISIQMPKDKNYSDKEKKILEKAAHHCPVGLSIQERIEHVEIVWD